MNSERIPMGATPVRNLVWVALVEDEAGRETEIARDHSWDRIWQRVRALRQAGRKARVEHRWA